jgi:hypothetical protein
MLASNQRMWHEMIRRYALWDCPQPTLDAFLGDMLEATCGVLTYCLDEMPRDRLLWVDFEELRAQPRRVMQSVLEFSGPEAPPGDLDRALARIPIHHGSRAEPPPDPRARRLEGLMAAARQKFGSQRPQ